MPTASATLSPFSCRFSPAIAELLCALDCSLALSTYQAGKLILLSPKPDGTGFYQYLRTFDRPMGIAVSDELLAVATRDRVELLANSRDLAPRYPKKPDTYDSLYIPRARFNTGQLDIHDIAFSSRGILAVNTLFSCIARIDATHSFVPVWQPPFIKDLVPDDCCHLNGMAIDSGGVPALVTALGSTDSRQGWRQDLPSGGVLVDVKTGQTLASGLSMPHSPRIIGENIWLLQSGEGTLCRFESGKVETVASLPGFARGFAVCGDHAFVGISRLRPNHRFGHLPIAKIQPFCGVTVVHLPTGAIVGSLEFLTSCEEIYDVQAIIGLGRPAIVRDDDPFCTSSLTLPGRTFLGEAPDAE
ncbi:MAG: TIGR03032 family protein [Verrucomicrobiales bacterium]